MMMKTPQAKFVMLFKPQFAPLVECGLKCQTVRPVPKRMPHPGDRISLREWTGKPYRSKQRVLREATITSVGRCRVRASSVTVEGVAQAPEEFARADGFPSFYALADWFHHVHGLPFDGLLICWE